MRWKSASSCAVRSARCRRVGSVLAGTVALVVAHATAHAQTPPTPATTPAAEPGAADPVDALIRHGVELRSLGQDDAAVLEFRRAFEISHTPRALAQVALAEQALGQWLSADAHLRAALESLADPWIERNASALRQSLATVGQHLARLEIRGGVPGAEVLIDNHPVGTLPLAEPLQVLAGSVNLEIRARHYLPLLRAVVVSPGSLSRENIELVPVPTAGDGDGLRRVDGAAVRDVGAERSHGLRISPLVYAGGGVAVVAGAIAIVLGVVGNGLAEAYRADCVVAEVPRADCAMSRVDGQRTLDGYAAGVNVLWSVSAVGLIAAVVGLIRSDFSGTDRVAATGTARRRPRARPVLILGANSAALRFAW